MEKKTIKTTGATPKKCEFCGSESIVYGDPYTDNDVHVETWYCVDCGARCQQLYRIEEDEIWLKDE